jgi:hypothetical protein
MAVASAMLARQSSHESGQSKQNEVVRVADKKTHSWKRRCAVGYPLLGPDLVLTLVRARQPDQPEDDL